MKALEVKSHLDPVFKVVAEKISDTMLSKDSIVTYTLDSKDENEIDVIYNEKLDKYVEVRKGSYTFYIEKSLWYLVGKIGSNINDTKLIFCVSLMTYVPKDRIKRNVALRLYTSLEYGIAERITKRMIE